MPTDRHYLLFVHDVNTRERRESPDYADYLFDLINCKVRSSSPGHVSSPRQCIASIIASLTVNIHHSFGLLLADTGSLRR